jgi:hypothetical protein
MRSVGTNAEGAGVGAAARRGTRATFAAIAHVPTSVNSVYSYLTGFNSNFLN